MPLDMKLKGKVGKYVLRKAAEPWLPRRCARQAQARASNCRSRNGSAAISATSRATPGTRAARRRRATSKRRKSTRSPRAPRRQGQPRPHPVRDHDVQLLVAGPEEVRGRGRRGAARRRHRGCTVMLIDLREQGDAAIRGARRLHRRRRRRRHHAGAAARATRAQRLPAGKRRPRLRAADAGSVPRRERRHAVLRPRPVAAAVLRRHDRHLGRTLRAARPDRLRAARLGAAQRLADRAARDLDPYYRVAHRAVRAGRVQLRARHLVGARHRARMPSIPIGSRRACGASTSRTSASAVALEGPHRLRRRDASCCTPMRCTCRPTADARADSAHRGPPARWQATGSEGPALRARLRRDRERTAAARLQRRRVAGHRQPRATRSAAISWSIPPAGSAGCTPRGRTRCGMPSRSASCRPGPPLAPVLRLGDATQRAARALNSVATFKLQRPPALGVPIGNRIYQNLKHGIDPDRRGRALDHAYRGVRAWFHREIRGTFERIARPHGQERALPHRARRAGAQSREPRAAVERARRARQVFAPTSTGSSATPTSTARACSSKPSTPSCGASAWARSSRASGWRARGRNGRWTRPSATIRSPATIRWARRG